MANKYKAVKKVLDDYAVGILESYKRRLVESGTVASGGLLETTSRSEIIFNPNNTEFQIIFNIEDYYIYVEDGRLSGSFPPVDAIKEWIRVKNIIPQPYQLPSGKTVIPTQDQLAFLIGRKIYEEGIPPNPILLETINEFLETLVVELSQAYAKDIKEELKELIIL